jgi:hypothetical protein
MNERAQMRLYRAAALTAATLLAALAPALVVASLPALVVASLSQSIQILPVALTVTLGHTVILGLPCFFILESRRGVNAISAIAAGLAVGALPFGILIEILRLVATGVRSNVWTNGVPTVVNGVRTLAGWIEFFESVIQLGLFGALAGLVFWLTLKVWERRAAPAEIIANLPLRRRPIRSAASVGTLALAVLLTTSVFAIPVITKDRTCHNMFRDGRTSVGSQANMYVSMGMDEWPKLTEIFDHFAPAHGMSIRNSSLNRADVRILALSLCTEQGTNINVIDQRWASRDFASLLGGTPITVYELRENSGWQKLAADLLVEIRAAFPEKLEFRGGDGRVIPTPAELENGRAR